jgi:hypothetical protein
MDYDRMRQIEQDIKINKICSDFDLKQIATEVLGKKPVAGGVMRKYNKYIHEGWSSRALIRHLMFSMR